MAYIKDSDISRDVLANQFKPYTVYHALVDEHIEGIAEGLMVETTDISVDDDGYLTSEFLRRYAASWVCKELFSDKMGINNNTLTEEDKYFNKYKIHCDRVKSMKPRITYEMLTDNIKSRMDTSASRNVYRG